MVSIVFFIFLASFKFTNPGFSTKIFDPSFENKQINFACRDVGKEIIVRSGLKLIHSFKDFNIVIEYFLDNDPVLTEKSLFNKGVLNFCL